MFTKSPEKCARYSLVHGNVFCMVRGDTEHKKNPRCQKPLTTTLSALGLLLRDLGCRRALRSGDLGLLSLLFLLLALGFLDGGSSLSGSDLGTLVSLCNDRSHISTNNTTLVLHGLSGPLLRNFLGNTLLVKASIWDSP